MYVTLIALKEVSLQASNRQTNQKAKQASKRSLIQRQHDTKRALLLSHDTTHALLPNIFLSLYADDVPTQQLLPTRHV
jgi:hypothetical protein